MIISQMLLTSKIYYPMGTQLYFNSLFSKNQKKYLKLFRKLSNSREFGFIPNVNIW